MAEYTHDVSTGPDKKITHHNDTSYSSTGHNNTYTYENTYENATSHMDTGHNETYTFEDTYANASSHSHNDSYSHETTHIYNNGSSYSDTWQTPAYTVINGTSQRYAEHNYTYGRTHTYHNGTSYSGSGHTSTYTNDIHINTNGILYNGAGESDTYDHTGTYLPEDYHDDYHGSHLPGDYANDDQSLHYSSYFFEKIIYLYIWEILVIITCLLNIVVISVLLRKKMRSPTYMILVAVSISDSLTGLVTLPTYIPVFQDAEEIYKPATEYNEYDASMHMPANMSQEDLDYFYSLNEGSFDPAQMPTYSSSLSTELCTGFMITKFFLSKSFHTVSVWLTVFLATHRTISVWSPFKNISCTLNIQRTSIMCTVLFILAPLLHVYHLVDDKSMQGHCEWSMGEGKDCGTGCAYLWIVLILGHLLPCTVLLIFTVMFAYNLNKSTSSLQRAFSRSTSTSSNQTTSTASISKSMSSIWRRVSTIGSRSEIRRPSSASVFSNRQRENRRASVVVIAIVVMFLIPEAPYSVYLAYNAISAHSSYQVGLRTNRSLMAAYDIMLVVSFNANFYIYTFFNRRFRQVLRDTIIAPICRACSALGVRSNNLFAGKFWRRPSYSINATTGPTTPTQSDRVFSSNKGAIELVGLNSKKKQNVQESSMENESSGRNVEGEEIETLHENTIEVGQKHEFLGRNANNETLQDNTIDEGQKDESLGRKAEKEKKELLHESTIDEHQKEEKFGRNAEKGTYENTIEESQMEESLRSNAEKEESLTLLENTTEEGQEDESFGSIAEGGEKGTLL